MGQYYNPIAIDKKEYVYSHDFGSGLKLMEHSYVGNDFVREVEKLLNDQWAGSRFVWAGDYAEPIDNIVNGPNHYHLCDSVYRKLKKLIVSKEEGHAFQYVLNLDTNEFVDILKTPWDKDGWQVHALPLLTCDGNGKGGGDYRRENEYTGKWAYNRIKTTNNPDEIYAMTEIFPNFEMD